jgi:hypothetical protein
MKILAWILAGVVLIAGGFYVLGTEHRRESNIAPAATTTTETAKAALTAHDFSWRVEKAANWEETLPREVVYLDAKGMSFKLGESIGCDGSSEPTEQNELMRKQCWFGGAGDVYALFNENGAFVAKHKWIQESGGPEVNAPPEGPWEMVSTIH